MEETQSSNPVATEGVEGSNVSESVPAQDVQQAAEAPQNGVEDSGLSMDDMRRIDEGRDLEVSPDALQAGTRGETAVDPEAATTAAQPEETPEGFDLLNSDLPEDETFELDGFYKGIKPEHIEKLDPLSKRVIHNLRRDYHNKRQRDAAQARAQDVVHHEKEQVLKDRERALLAQQKAFADLLNDDKLRQVLAQPEADLPDVMSPEGIEARIERATAQKLSELIQPVQEATQVADRRNALQDFMDVNPEMQREGFRNEVATLIRNRKQMGFAISTPDAYEIVKSRQAQAATDKQRARDRQVRAAAARQIGKGASNASTPSGPPKGARAQEIYDWLKAHPEEAKRYRSGRR